MTIIYLTYALLAALAIILLIAAWTDHKRRQIDHWVSAAIAALAPIYWWNSGLVFWPDMSLQIAIGLGVFLVGTLAFAFRLMGGGDVKLMSALSLWFPWTILFKMWMVMSFFGLFLTFYCVYRFRKDRAQGKIDPKTDPQIPYGIAISFSGLWVITEHYLNHFM